MRIEYVIVSLVIVAIVLVIALQMLGGAGQGINQIIKMFSRT